MIQLILLSGGSGTRLWPLSNEARSKQFLYLLEGPDGKMESMVQRVTRQISESGLECEITVATNLIQKDSIDNQLGDGVNIVTEPHRRKTFAAISLATTYLSLEKKCSEEDVVVVMPCDPYTEAEYFSVIGKMADCAKKNVADLILMGIKPTYPSTKYGYVTPKKEADGFIEVERFVEKPDVATAQSLIDKNGLWNGGVFAFKLGYMTEIVKRYIRVESYEELCQRYDELPMISFDYEIVEKADSIAAVPYYGEWRDLGTWNTLSEVLPSNAIGNVTMGSECTNTHVVNELSVPIFCNGLDDMIVAAGPDGILVAAKKSAETIKSYAGQLAHRPMYEERRWGKYTVMGHSTYSDGYKSLTKNLTLYPGKNISYQVHLHRDELWTFVDGEGLLVLDGFVRKVGRGDVVHISKGQYHALRAITELTFIEVQTGDLLEESDIIRTNWDWE